jgi:hypothetical protein
MYNCLMLSRVSTSLAVLALAVGTLGAQAPPENKDEKLGAGVTLTEATPIKDLYESPAKFVGKTIRIDGVVTAVCESMGCWMALATDEASAKTQTIRFKVDHEAGIVFPLKSKGMKASAQGVFERIGDAEGREAASEDKNAPDFGKTYQIKATGAVIR